MPNFKDVTNIRLHDYGMELVVVKCVLKDFFRGVGQE